ncbi:hypothetical protein HanXRQr2_Chr03g0090121 [Helianthus annuus]|uniref:Uncharacterized protein n=1 Tax=Helianthus annuus TaxID=4232 RepID=A0A9K3NTN4_HELAN|nr:hypothetical protein HanXRQr2_Chr03g0090121 [Helianthus annuus]
MCPLRFRNKTVHSDRQFTVTDSYCVLEKNTFLSVFSHCVLGKTHFLGVFSPLRFRMSHF